MAAELESELSREERRRQNIERLAKLRPIYSFSRLDEETGEPLGDDEHIIFVNGAYRNEDDNSDLAKLIHDFKCSNADDMYIEPLAEKTRYCKENPKGVSEMCKIVEDMVAEEIAVEKCRDAVRLIKMGLLPLDKIAEGLNLPLETIKELAEKYKGKSA